MKKLSLFLMVILAFGLTSCDETFVEPIPQFNPQEPILTGYGLTVEIGANISVPLDINVLETEIEAIKTLSATPELTGSQKVEYIAYVSNSDDFKKNIQIDVVDGMIAKADLNTAYRTLFGKTPKANDMYIQFAAFLADGTSRVRYGTKDTYYAQTVVSVTPIPMEFVVEEAYYLVGDVCGWDIAKAIKFSHSEADVYDDPVFTANVEVGANSYWKIIPKSGMENIADQWKGHWGVAVDGSTDVSGTLINENPNAAKIEKAGWVRISINMMNNTYTVEPLGDPYIYLVGNPNGWDINSDKCRLESKNRDDIYTGTFALTNNGENNFRFYSKLGNWDEGSIGAQVDDNPTDITDKFVDGVYTGSVVSGKGSFGITKDGMYKITVNLVAKTIKIQEANVASAIYMVGTINNWSLDATATQGKLICNTGNEIYKATLTLPDSGDGFSYFRFYNDLTGSWDDGTIGTESGTDEIPEFDEGATMFMVVPGKQGSFKVLPGTYDVEVDLNENIVTMTKK